MRGRLSPRPAARRPSCRHFLPLPDVKLKERETEERGRERETARESDTSMRTTRLGPCRSQVVLVIPGGAHDNRFTAAPLRAAASYTVDFFAHILKLPLEPAPSAQPASQAQLSAPPPHAVRSLSGFAPSVGGGAPRSSCLFLTLLTRRCVRLLFVWMYVSVCMCVLAQSHPFKNSSNKLSIPLPAPFSADAAADADADALPSGPPSPTALVRSISQADYFAPLLTVLDELSPPLGAAAGSKAVKRSLLALKLQKYYPVMYESREWFRSYIEQATTRGLITTGGAAGNAWVEKC